MYNDEKAKYMEHNHRLIKKVYRNGLSVRGAYDKEGFEETETRYRDDNDIVLEKITTDNYEKLLKQYITLKEEAGDEVLMWRYEIEFPEFKEAVERFGKSRIETCKYRQKNIKDLLNATSPDTKQHVYKAFFKEVGNETFISKYEAKVMLRTIYSIALMSSGINQHFQY